MNCAVPGCERERVCRGWCRPHYRRWMKRGDVGPVEVRVHSSEPTHGTLHGYRYHKCRCATCVEAWRAYQRQWAAENPHLIHLKDRRRNLMQNYGMTTEDYDDLLAAQGGGCAICGIAENPTARKRYLSVDHDHATGEVRGILCDHCNQGVGRFMDDPERLRAAADYLERIREVSAT